jgi:hypothetical protein
VKFIQLILPYGTTVESLDVQGTPVQFNTQGIDLGVQTILLIKMMFRWRKHPTRLSSITTLMRPISVSNNKPWGIS